MNIKFWGVRGSIPTPIGPKEIRKKIEDVLFEAKDIKFSSREDVTKYVEGLHYLQRGTVGGNSSCVEVQTQTGHVLILDAGSGIVKLGAELMKGDFGRGSGVAHIFLSHTHWDHIIGFPLFTPAYIKGNRIIFYGVHEDLEKRLRHQQNAPDHFPASLELMEADIEFVQLKGKKKLKIGSMTVDSKELYHPGAAYSYRITENEKTLVYATDGEYKVEWENVQQYHSYYQNADVLIFDAMYTAGEAIDREDWGHSTSFIGADIASITGIKKLVLFHHYPARDDEAIHRILKETEAYWNDLYSDFDCEILMAHEGLEIEI